MSVLVFSEWLSSFGADRAKMLYAEETIDGIYALLHPTQPASVSNHLEWWKFGDVPLWAWINCSADQASDALAIGTIEAAVDPFGYLLDIEGAWTKNGTNLGVVVGAAVGTGKPVIASLAAITSSHVEYDYRTLDMADVSIDWQCYFDSGEGSTPAIAVRELYRPSFVIAGWQYRNRLGKTYGWGRVERVEHSQGIYNAYKRPGLVDATFAIGPREWGHTVIDGKLWRDGVHVGELMGRARYSKIRATLDTTRGANDKHDLFAWEVIAASARVPGASRRPISVYMAESSSDDVLRAIAKGAP